MSEDEIPTEENVQSKALGLINSQGWSSQLSGTSQHKIHTCPLCSAQGFKFYINTSGEEKDGLWQCKVCKEKGNYWQLIQRVGIRTKGAVSIKDAVAPSPNNLKPLPDFGRLHAALMNEPQNGLILDYLVAERGFSIETIEKLKMGAMWHTDKKGEHRPYAVIPYFSRDGLPVNFKARSVTGKKSFLAPAGRDASLFNEGALVRNMSEIFLCEGEMDTVALIDKGLLNVVGVPGCDVKKATWIDLFTEMGVEKVFILYDNDKQGQHGAKTIASRIGVDRCYNIVLPEFEEGNDINAWLRAGHTLEELHALKDKARLFDVSGVQSAGELLDELREEFSTQGSDPSYLTPWPSLTTRLGGAEPGDLIGVMAEGKVGKTTMALNWLDWHVNMYDVPGLMFCLEMPPKRMIRKWASMVTGTDDTPGISKMTPETIDEAKRHAREEMRGDLLFAYTKSTKAEDCYELIRQAHKRYGIKVVVFDNLQLLVRSLQYSTQETTRISAEFKALAMELNIFVILIVQPHRVQQGMIVSARNANGSSAIEKNVDAMICVHRNRVGGDMREKDFNGFSETPVNFEPHMLVRVDLCRYGPGGSCTLMIDGATSTVREYMPSDDIPAVNPETGGIPEESQAI